jgi:hypothetical protein
MRKVYPGWIGAVVAALMLLSVAAPAQERRQGGRRQGLGRITLAQVPAPVLETALKLNAGQKTKIADIQAKYQEATRALRPQNGGQPDRETQRANAQKRQQLSQQASQEIEAILNAEQKSKVPGALEELGQLRRAGVPLEIAHELKLTDEQKRQIAAIARAAQDKMQGMSPEERREKGREMMQEAGTKMQEVLTTEQKARVEKWRKDNPRRRAGNRPARRLN